jgi:serine/threonine protein kinase
MYACLTGSLPFNPETGRPRILSEKIVTVTYKLPDDLMSPGAAQIIKALLVKEPMARITISELLRHPWFAL